MPNFGQHRCNLGKTLTSMPILVQKYVELLKMMQTFCLIIRKAEVIVQNEVNEVYKVQRIF